MKRILMVSLCVFTFCILASAQKVDTVLGDAWTGEVIATNDSSREITIKYRDKGKSETFTGVLSEGYKIKMKDGTSHDLSVAEIPVGTRVRVFSQRKDQDAGGKKIKINLITRIDFPGVDEFSRLREQLNIPPSVPVEKAESKALPAGNPLKMFLAIENRQITDSFVAWVEKWNKDKGLKYGSIQIVSDMSAADVFLVRYRGSNLIVEIIQTATVFLVVPNGNGLNVIWKQAVATDPDQSSSPFIEKEIEKRMKARKSI
jgi:hypothetical protein